MTKVLVSHGYGAGWSTWSNNNKAVAEYAPIIEFLENGGDRNALSAKDHPLIKQMKIDIDDEYFHTGGAEGLVVEEVDGPYRIDEYDGMETLITAADFW